jgi:2-polyprenyl-3-methyl-5-hydroxy-6-metoxy-1,4-benzoquinol methylase
MRNNLNCVFCLKPTLKQISSTYRLDTFKDNFILVECQSCNHVSINNTPSEEKLKNYYENEFWDKKITSSDIDLEWSKVLTSSSSAYERFLRAKKQFRYITSKLALDKNIKIIDIGSGYAPILYHFNRSNYKNLFALELDSDICKYLNQQNINSINVSVEELSTMNECFDLIIISHTLEHIADSHMFLKLIKNIAKKDTLLFIEVPYKDYLEPYNENLHLNYFSKESLSIVLEDTNFRVINIDIDRHNVLDIFLLKILFYIYGKLLFKSNKSINAKSNIIELLHYLWRPFKLLLSSKINIHISRKDIRTISKYLG